MPRRRFSKGAGNNRRRRGGQLNGRILETTRVRVSSSTSLDIRPNQFPQIQGIGRPVKAVRASLSFLRDATTVPTAVQLLAIEPTTGNTVRQSKTAISSINPRMLSVTWPASVAPFGAASSAFPLVSIRHGTFQTADSTSIDGILKVWFTYGPEISDITGSRVLTTTSGGEAPAPVSSCEQSSTPAYRELALLSLESASKHELQKDWCESCKCTR